MTIKAIDLKPGQRFIYDNEDFTVESVIPIDGFDLIIETQEDLCLVCSPIEDVELVEEVD